MWLGHDGFTPMEFITPVGKNFGAKVLLLLKQLSARPERYRHVFRQQITCLARFLSWSSYYALAVIELGQAVKSALPQN